MKVGSVEGTPQEVRDLFENNGLDLSAYITKPETPLHRIWLIIPASALVICFGVLSLISNIPSNGKVFIFLVGFAASAWLGISIHIKFKTSWGAFAAILAGLLIMLVSLGVLTPAQLLEYYKNFQKDP